jgi:hypothetical protein
MKIPSFRPFIQVTALDDSILVPVPFLRESDHEVGPLASDGCVRDVIISTLGGQP